MMRAGIPLRASAFASICLLLLSSPQVASFSFSQHAMVMQKGRSLGSFASPALRKYAMLPRLKSVRRISSIGTNMMVDPSSLGIGNIPP
jgi:hypothetical protein